MGNEENKSVAQEIRRKLRDLELTHSAELGSSQSPKNQKNTGKSGIVKFIRAIIILAVTITIGAVVIMVSTNAFKKRQQDMDGKVETPIVKEAIIQVSQIDFNVVSDTGSRMLKVRAVLTNTGNTPGTIGRARFEAFDQSMTLITDWPSPLLTEPINPGEDRVIESSFFEPPGEVFSVRLNLEKVFSQN
jgi:hypothetical protein